MTERVIGDHYRIDGPALISFSGGRTSAFMLWQVIQAHRGSLPPDVHATFANTGKEMPQTLDFVRDCGDRWGVEIVWLEYRDAETISDRWCRVDHTTASRAGEPFEALIDRKGYLPNPATRFCTSELKVRPMRDYAQSLGWKNWVNVIGLRADEPRRVAKARENREAWDNAMPLAAAGATKQDVMAFWKRQNFDLALPNINGTTPLGNCDLCFLKSTATISGIMRDMPERSAWWVAQEAKPASKPSGARFRESRAAYAELLDTTQRQGALAFDADGITHCICGDDA
jgi:3'-phosphoadenosine 5'-phosphosulfate sulfotransferase (PAPS reductase)/FAD synthetase